ncbi:hypothetical protein [Castellaniella sp. S9]|uniref:hypothetical protein n=1 Tax=Castellaniella sp. S9 TaxID=2993652 RepID=UPI0022B3AD83|nr:hypothetical protein [Castellaniella sp. S9]
MTKKGRSGTQFGHPDAYLIEALGGTRAAALIFDVRPQVVSKYRKTGMPKYRKAYLKLLRPDLFEGPAAITGQAHCADAQEGSHA